MPTDNARNIKQTIDNVVKQVKEICDELNPIMNNSEKEYLQIGANLYTIAEQAGKISELSMNCSELLMGEATLEIISNLRMRFKNLDSYFLFSIKKIEEDKEFLKLVLSEFRKIDAPFESFKKIVKHLNMLSISIRIESSRLSSEGNTFTVLAEDVLKLAKSAETILNEITSLIGKIYESMEKLFNSIDDLKENKYLITRNRLQPIHNVLDEFWQEQEKYSDVSKNISDHMVKTQNDINEIVISLQLQDIVKQNLQHVNEALQGQIINEYNNRNIELDSFVSKVPVILNIQANQIKDSEKSISTSIGNVKKSLEEIAISTAGVESEVGHIIDICQNTGKDIIKNAENNVLDITNSLADTVTTHNGIINQIHQTLALVDQIALTLKNIDELDITIKILTYNGLIHATRIGNEGAALRVIADSIQRLSNDSQKQVHKLNIIIEAVKKHAGEVKMKENDEEIDTTKNVVEGISSELKEFFAKLIGINKNMADNNFEYNRTLADFKNNLQDTLNGIKIDRVFSDKASKMINTLLGLGIQLNPYQNNQSQEQILKDLNVIHDSYTMDSERDVHNKTLNNQYFNSTSLASVDDDNVELF